MNQIISRKVFITGGTGYVGHHLISELLKHGHEVYALTRESSVHKLPSGCHVVVGNPLDKDSYQGKISSADTFVHLIGTAHPSPKKGELFRKIDLVSIQTAVSAANYAGIKHFIYVSVAHPAPVMKDYIQVRMEGEALIRESIMNATILRPWYILGPKHWWPYILLPAYWIFKRLPWTKNSAQRLGFVTIKQMIKALVAAIESPSQGIRILEVPQIRDFKV